MLLLVTAIPADQFFSDPLGILLFEDLRPPHREAGNVDFRLGGMISRWIQQGTVDPGSPTPTLFSPGSSNVFPLLVISGAGPFHELSAPATERILAGIMETLLRVRAPLFGLAVRDFKKPLTPPRDSAEILLRGMAHGAHLAGITSGHTVRLHWEPDEADSLLQELRRFRFHLPASRDWQIDRAPEDQEWMRNST